jgi:hypothetical protein
MKQETVSLSFVAQEWDEGYLIDVDPHGPLTWTVHKSEFLALFPDAESFASKHQDRDSLRLHDNAPEWVREWTGPFEVELEDESQTPWG